MPDRSKKRRFSIVDLILILSVIFLIYLFYLFLGGDWNILARLRSYSGGESVLDSILGNLSAIGQGIGNAFSGMFR